MSLVLLVGAGLFLRSWQQMLAVDPGLRPGSDVDPVRHDAGHAIDSDDAVQRTRRLLERFRALPGVEAVGLVWPLPLEFSSSFTDFTIDGRVPPPGREAFRAERATVDGGFFDAAGMAIVAGRTFNDGDRRDSQPVAVISQAMARRYWPDGDALGRILRRPDPAEPDLVIVGVASDINVRSLGEAPRDVVYEPYTQGDGSCPCSTSSSARPLIRRGCSLALVAAARGDRSGPAGRPVHDDGAASGDVASAVADRRVHAVGVCRHRHGAGGHRGVRDGALHGGQAHSRGRDPHGARRRRDRRRAVARDARRATGAGRRRDRRSRVARSRHASSRRCSSESGRSILSS